jgi:predicted ribosome quality control (RQC) complex YloA/Tae2 family protein
MNQSLRQIPADDKNLSNFRIFNLPDDCQVWVGKNREANDLLTFKYSNQYDLWFHVRGSSGSHTVLKLPQKDYVPAKDVIKQAASIAAYYSKSKNAKTVTVAYTQAKNVQKYKGAKSGSVVIKGEKVIKVAPGLPEDCETTGERENYM